MDEKQFYKIPFRVIVEKNPVRYFVGGRGWEGMTVHHNTIMNARAKVVRLCYVYIDDAI